MTSSLLVKILKIDKFGHFSCDIIKLTNVTPGDRRDPPADTKCPPAAQRNEAKRACMYIYLYIRVLQEIPKFEFYNAHSSNSLP